MSSAPVVLRYYEKQGGQVRGEIALSGVVARMATMRRMKMKYPAAFELVHPSQRPYYLCPDSGEVADADAWVAAIAACSSASPSARSRKGGSGILERASMY